jgi:hypothetical protein
MKNLILVILALGVFADDPVASSSPIPITPSVLSGILITLMLLVFLATGFYTLGSINGPTVYTPVPLLVGKER